jgi:hypothetical protein
MKPPTSIDVSRSVAWVPRSVEVAMERIRIPKPVKPRERPKILPLDPRDPEILRAKTLRERAAATRHRAA